MKPAPFDYLRAGSLDEALAALAEHGSEARIIAGGQSLLPMLNMRLAKPALLVDIMGVACLGEPRHGDRVERRVQPLHAGDRRVEQLERGGLAAPHERGLLRRRHPLQLV